jgi:small neutral amino acid transporter SnatA (MarC family)
MFAENRDFINAVILLLVLLNPFLMCVYLLDLVQHLDARTFRKTMIRAGTISGVVYILFAIVGDQLFSVVLNVRFEAFLIFGGIVFLIVSIKLVTAGSHALRDLRGGAEHVSEGVALPFMIGPGTISASILAGKSQSIPMASIAIIFSVVVSLTLVILLKYLHDYVKTTHEPLLERYLDTIGRVSALLMGTIAVDMLLRGVNMWLDSRLTESQ